MTNEALINLALEQPEEEPQAYDFKPLGKLPFSIQQRQLEVYLNQLIGTDIKYENVKNPLVAFFYEHLRTFKNYETELKNRLVKAFDNKEIATREDLTNFIENNFIFY